LAKKVDWAIGYWAIFASIGSIAYRLIFSLAVRPNTDTLRQLRVLCHIG